jgi:hypothetical protein
MPPFADDGVIAGDDAPDPRVGLRRGGTLRCELERTLHREPLEATPALVVGVTHRYRP